jgi:K+ transporter
MTVKVSEIFQKLSTFTMENILFLPFCLVFFITVGTTRVIERYTNHTLVLAVNPLYAIGALLFIRQTELSTFPLFLCISELSDSFIASKTFKKHDFL